MAHGMVASLVCHSAVPRLDQIGQIGHEITISGMSDLGANETLFGCLICVSHFAKKIGIFYSKSQNKGSWVVSRFWEDHILAIS